MGNRQKMEERRRYRIRILLLLLMVVFLLFGCGVRMGADASAVQPSEVSASASGLLSFSELSEIPDGSYWIRVSMTGGSGRASISSPTGFYVKDGQATADIHWSSASYDYMKLDGVRYEAFTDAAGHSAMTIPVSALDTAIPVLADTTAMSKPYEIEYELSFDGSALLPMADASMAEAHALPTDELQRAMQSATTQVADAGSSDSAAGNGNSTSAGSNLAAAAGDAQVTNGQSGTSTGTAGALGTTDADGRVLWSAAPEIDGLTFVSSEKNDVAE